MCLYLCNSSPCSEQSLPRRALPQEQQSPTCTEYSIGVRSKTNIPILLPRLVYKSSSYTWFVSLALQAVFPTSFMSMQCAVVPVPLSFWSHLVVTICKVVAIYQPHNVGLESSVQYNSIKHAEGTFEGGCSCSCEHRVTTCD